MARKPQSTVSPWNPAYVGASSGAQCYGDIHRASLPLAEKRAHDCELMPAGTCKGQHADRTMEAPTYRLTEAWAKRPARKAEQERRAAKAAEHAAFVAAITGGALKAAEPAPGPAVGRQDSDRSCWAAP